MFKPTESYFEFCSKEPRLPKEPNMSGCILESCVWASNYSQDMSNMQFNEMELLTEPLHQINIKTNVVQNMQTV